MKKHLLPKLFATVTSIFAVTFLFAQDQNSVAANNLKRDGINIATAPISEPVPGKTTAFVKPKVMRSFFDYFGDDISEIKWSDNNGRYFASFAQNGKQCRALFNRSGALLFSLRYDTEKDLPRDIRKLLKSTYIDYEIGVVTAVEVNNQKAWVANLTDKDNLIVVHICEGVLEELHRYKTHF